MVKSNNSLVNSEVNGNSEMPLTNPAEIIERMKEASGTSTDVDLAQVIGKHKQNITNAKKRGVPLNWVLEISTQFDYSLDWLVHGEEPRKRVDRSIEGEKRPPIDNKLLENIIAAVEGGLNRRELTMDPDKKAQAVSLLYELYADTQKEVTEETVVRYLKLVA
jgi:Bacteriophage CI repressor helix-turn-helix domain